MFQCMIYKNKELFLKENIFVEFLVVPEGEEGDPGGGEAKVEEAGPAKT